MELRHIDIANLSVSTANMRSRGRPDIANILPSVRTRGILVPLIVRANGTPDTFEIVAGKRRYFAAHIVAEEAGGIDPLPCAVIAAGDDAAALETSLIENIARLDPDEVTRWESFTRLVKQGRNPEDISLTFGLTELQVEAHSRPRQPLAAHPPALSAGPDRRGHRAAPDPRIEGAAARMARALGRRERPLPDRPSAQGMVVRRQQHIDQGRAVRPCHLRRRDRERPVRRGKLFRADAESFFRAAGGGRRGQGPQVIARPDGPKSWYFPPAPTSTAGSMSIVPSARAGKCSSPSGRAAMSRSTRATSASRRRDGPTRRAGERSRPSRSAP